MGTVQTLLIVALLMLGYSLREVVAVSVLITMLSLVINTAIARRLLPRLSLPVWHSATFRRLLHFGGFVTVSGVVGPVLANLEKLILANRASLSAVTYYTVPYNVSSKLGIVSGSLSSALFPAFSSMHGSGDRARVGRIVLETSRILMLLLLPVTILLIVFSQEILSLWMGQEFATRSTSTLQILSLAMLMNVMAHSPLAVVQALGRPDLAAKFHVAELITHVPLTYLLVGYLGIEGAALSWLIRVAMDTTLLWWATIRLTGLTWLRTITSLFNQGVMGVVAGGIVLAGFKLGFKDRLSLLESPLGFGLPLLMLAILLSWKSIATSGRLAAVPSDQQGG